MAKKKGTIKKFIFGILGTIVLFVIIVIVNLILFEKNGSVVSKGIAIENYGEQKKALLVIDIQEATTGEISASPFYIENADKLIKNINLIAQNYRDQNIPVIYIRSEITNPLINLLNNSYAKGSIGAQFDKRLNKVSNIELVKSKNDSFIDTGLDNILTTNKINELYIVGLDAAHCINTTVEAAQNRNYSVNLIEDAILSESIEMKDSMMVVFKNRGVKITRRDSL